jgi:hypothetical protein
MPERYDYGPLRTYEVMWRTRPPEVVQGHSITFDSSAIFTGRAGGGQRFKIYGMFGENWRMVLMGLEDDVTCIRDVTEQMQALEALAKEPPDGV